MTNELPDEGPLHKRLEAELADQLAEAALRCEAGEVRDLERSQVVRVTNFDVQTAARCQAKAAAPGSDFEPSIFTTSRAVALRSVRRLKKSGSVVAAVSDTMRHIRRAGHTPDDGPGADLDWLGEYLTDEAAAPIDVRVRIAARATTWLTTTLDVLGVDNLAATTRWRHDIRPRWRYPGRGLSLEGRVDLAVPVNGNFTPIFVVNSLHPAALQETAFNVYLWTINQRRSPFEVVVVDLPTASKRVFEPHDLFPDGAEAARVAAEAVTHRPADSPGGLQQQAGPMVCSDCDWASTCEAKAAFDQAPVRKGGLQLT